MRDEIKIHQGDKNYNLNFTLQNYNGEAINLTNASLVLKTQKKGSVALGVTGDMIVRTPLIGDCYYQVQENDFEAGIYDAEIEITYTSGEKITYGDIIIKVTGDLPK